MLMITCNAEFVVKCKDLKLLKNVDFRRRGLKIKTGERNKKGRCN